MALYRYVLVFIVPYVDIELEDNKQFISNIPRIHTAKIHASSGPKVIKLFSCSTQLSMKFVLLINFKLQTIAKSFLLNVAEHENFSANKYENADYCCHFHIY